MTVFSCVFSMRYCRSGVPVVLAILLVRLASAQEQRSLPESTVVIYNKSVSESADLAKFYAQRRGIARDHLVAVECSADEEIGREEYETTIAQPIRDIFRQRGWWKYRVSDGKESVIDSTIQFAAVIKGMPLKIRQTVIPFGGDQPGEGPIADRSSAAVDSELATLALNYKQISGATANPYYQSFRGVRDFENSILLLTCRLDAPTSATVRRMITDSISAEKNGLWGRAYVDASHNLAPGASLGDAWMREICDQLAKVGVPVVYDNSPGVFPSGYPASDCALYYGWYTGQAAGPFADPDFRFVPGAIGVHIHSYSANSLHDPNANWVAPLLMHGAAASLGNVYEPYLQLTTNLSAFNDRLLHGFTFAESAYMATPSLSWMNVMVGDPLYRPYGSWMQLEARDYVRAPNEWKMYHDFAVRNISRAAPDYRTRARLVASRARNGLILEDLAGMEARDQKFSAAASLFQQARATYSKRDDILRVVIEEVDALVRDNRKKRAVDLLRQVLRIVPDAPATPLLRQMEQSLTAPPPAPTPGPSP